MEEINSKRKTLKEIFKTSLPAAADLSSQTITWLMWLAVSTVSIYEIFGSWLLAIPLGFGLSGLWMIQGLDELTRFSLNLWRFNLGKWKEVRL